MVSKKIIFFFVIFFIIPSSVWGASLFISPENNEVNAGEIFTVLINLDSQNLAINAASADIRFDKSLLSVQSLGFLNSIFSLWVDEPDYSNTMGLIHFSGGLPSPGWTGDSGSVMRITFKAKAPGQANLNFENGSILANDGLGTDVMGMTKGSSINILDQKISPDTEADPVVPSSEVSRQTIADFEGIKISYTDIIIILSGISVFLLILLIIVSVLYFRLKFRK